MVNEAKKLVKKLRYNHLYQIRRWSIQGEAADIIEELLKSLQCNEEHTKSNDNEKQEK